MHRSARGTWALLAIIFLFAGPATLFASQAGQPRVPLNAAEVEQKANYLENLANRSVSARTIETAGPAARADLEKARALVAKARSELNSGAIAEADATLDLALGLITGQTRRLSEDRIATASLASAYDNRLKSVRAFIAAYSRVAREKRESSRLNQQSAALSQMVDEAEALKAKGQLAEAKARLDQAYQLTTKGLRQMRAGETLVRSLSFATPKEEYEYELDRNDSHFMLLKIATGDHPLDPMQAKAIEQFRSAAQTKRKTAEQQNSSGDYTAAIRSLEGSTTDLQKAIRASGLFIPG